MNLFLLTPESIDFAGFEIAAVLQNEKRKVF